MTRHFVLSHLFIFIQVLGLSVLLKAMINTEDLQDYFGKKAMEMRGGTLGLGHDKSSGADSSHRAASCSRDPMSRTGWL